jgi:hypothetical protein
VTKEQKIEHALSVLSHLGAVHSYVIESDDAGTPELMKAYYSLLGMILTVTEGHSLLDTKNQVYRTMKDLGIEV